VSETVFQVGAKDRGKRLDRFLQERIPALSRTWVQRAIGRQIHVSWTARARPSTRVQAGGEVRIGFPPLDETPLDLAIEILARGPGWMAIDKPAGIPVHPVNRVRENSLIRLLRRQEEDDGLRLVHRLDRETSGVLVVAGDSATARALSTAFERGEVLKEYVALVAGDVAGDAGTVNLPIGPSTESEIRVRLAPNECGKPAQTSWRVERRLAGRRRRLPRSGAPQPRCAPRRGRAPTPAAALCSAGPAGPRRAGEDRRDCAPARGRSRRDRAPVPRAITGV
jgi:23S rRNA-/tRNA-specific pseudouridylate synthase